MTTADSDSTPKQGRSLSKDLITIRTYVIPEVVPKSIEFSKHMMRFTGLKTFSAGKDLVWGVQGTTSLNSADAFASLDAQHSGRRVYQVELQYRLKGLPPAGASVNEAFANSAGYVHFSRIASPYRNVLREQMLDWLAEEGDPETLKLGDLGFEEMVKQRPMLIHKLMAESPHINTVVHPVLLPGGVSLRIATVRVKPENIVRVYTRFHEEIKTIV